MNQNKIEILAIDKIKNYLLSICKSEEHYQKLLQSVWINPNKRNMPCVHPELKCSDCPSNRLAKK